MTVASFLYSESSDDQTMRPTDEGFRKWDARVKSIILRANTKLEYNFNVCVYPGNHGMPALVTCLRPSFAANLASTSPGNPNRIRKMRARSDDHSIDLLMRRIIRSSPKWEIY